MGFKIRTEKEFIIKLLLLWHLLQCANISSEMLAPVYRTARCYSPVGSVHNCVRIQQDRQKGNTGAHSCNKFAAEKQKNSIFCVCVCVCVCVCSLSSPECNAHALYYIFICGLYGSNKFFYIIRKPAQFSEKSYWTWNVFWFCLQLLSEIFLIQRRIQRDMIKKCILVSLQSIHYSCQVLMKTDFSRQIFEKCSNIKFHENPPSGSSVPCGRTDTTYGRAERQQTWRS
jgi:hypothetical protein